MHPPRPPVRRVECSAGRRSMRRPCRAGTTQSEQSGRQQKPQPRRASAPETADRGLTPGFDTALQRADIRPTLARTVSPANFPESDAVARRQHQYAIASSRAATAVSSLSVSDHEDRARSIPPPSQSSPKPRAWRYCPAPASAGCEQPNGSITARSSVIITRCAVPENDQPGASGASQACRAPFSWRVRAAGTSLVHRRRNRECDHQRRLVRRTGQLAPPRRTGERNDADHARPRSDRPVDVPPAAPDEKMLQQIWCNDFGPLLQAAGGARPAHNRHNGQEASARAAVKMKFEGNVSGMTRRPPAKHASVSSRHHNASARMMVAPSGHWKCF